MKIADEVVEKKRKLDALKAKIRPGALDNLDSVQRIDITYTSNAIEGNTLTAGETALVIEKGITVSGKPLKDHLEAVDHARALDWVIEIGMQGRVPLRETDIRTLHQLVVAKSKPEIAGRYADTVRFVNTSAGAHHFPSHVDVPTLMKDFTDWLAEADDTPEIAFEAHRRLVGIHPFNDGNGRTARLLMNLILIRGGYPPIAIRPEDRPEYTNALEAGQAGGDYGAFHDLLYRRLDHTLDQYIAAATEAARSDHRIAVADQMERAQALAKALDLPRAMDTAEALEWLKWQPETEVHYQGPAEQAGIAAQIASAAERTTLYEASNVPVATIGREIRFEFKNDPPLWAIQIADQSAQTLFERASTDSLRDLMFENVGLTAQLVRDANERPQTGQEDGEERAAKPKRPSGSSFTP